jgi:hypothetical protein
VDRLRLPPCALPRPGDHVVWYQNGVKTKGELLGHTPESFPCIQAEYGMTFRPTSFDVIRLKDPMSAIGPNWFRLPSEATITTPHPHEHQMLSELLGQRVPPGTRHIDLVYEIWSRGFEVFLIGGTVREVIAGRASRDVDIATTMPIDRLHQLVSCMYGKHVELGDLDRLAGRMRVGGTPGRTDPYVDIRIFHHHMPGTEDAVFGASFQRDTAHRDFACNCVYYDPINDVFIDPTGDGLNDAALSRLRTVYDEAVHSTHSIARIAVRVFKFLCRGYGPANGHEDDLDRLLHQVHNLPAIELIADMKLQVFDSMDPSRRQKVYDMIHDEFVRLGDEPFWDRSIRPFREELLR